MGIIYNALVYFWCIFTPTAADGRRNQNHRRRTASASMIIENHSDQHSEVKYNYRGTNANK